MKLAIVLIVATLSLFACKKKQPSEPIPPALAEVTYNNVSYGSDSKQVMDIYLPANRNSNTNTLILVHGGAWFAGDKADMQVYMDSLKKRLPNYAIANVNYRLAFNPVNIYPTANNDLTAAISFIVGQSNIYSISNKVALMGVSAGGHLVLHEAYKNTATANVKCVISVFGIPDMTDMWNNPAGTAAVTRLGLTNYLGTTQTANAALYTAASPTTYVNAQSVPTQLFHGTADTLVRYQQSVNLKNKLTTLNVPVQYVEYPGEGHGWSGAKLTDTYSKLTLFVKQYLP
jgi:acetyl esterase/lipase